jgi:curved DNA-binding protein CbpA
LFVRREFRGVIDYFALLEQPRRPWLDLEQLKAKHQQLTLAAHPDRPDSDRVAIDFAAINQAYRVLSDPKQRLQHLLRLEDRDASGTQSVPDELLGLFGRIGTFIQEIDSLLGKLKTTNSALTKSLLRSEVISAGKRAEEFLEEVENLYQKALEDLRESDKAWETHPVEVLDELKGLLNRFAYLGRWIEQLREGQFQLSM